MRAFEIRETTGSQGWRLNEARPDPGQPGPGDVVVRVRATSINYRDLLIAQGRYGGGVIPGTIPLSDGAGEVVAVGDGVGGISPGDRVAGCFFPDWLAGAISPGAIARALGGSVDGMLAEYVVLPAQGVVPVPGHLGFAEAATLPCAGVTAWNTLVEVGQVRAGQTVLVLGTGGVSIFALQFAKMMGARVIVTSGRDDKLERAAALGADGLVNYRANPDWHLGVLDMTDGQGVDLVVEVGGAGTLERSLKAVKVGGTVAMVGVLAGQGQVDPRPLISRAVRLQGVFVGSRAMFVAMNRAIAQSGLRPVIDGVFPFEDARAAYEHQGAGAHFGKVVIGGT